MSFCSYLYITGMSLLAATKFSCVCGTSLHVVYVVDFESMYICFMYTYK
jgi:hypothetical protein